MGITFFFCQKAALKNPPCFVLLQHKKCELKCALMKILSEKCFEFFKFSNANLLREEINSKFFKYGLMETPFFSILLLLCIVTGYRVSKTGLLDAGQSTCFFERIFMLCDDAH